MVQHVWDLWFPGAGAQGLSFARGRLDATDSLWVHAAPDMLNVHVRADDDALIAVGLDLKGSGDVPMTRLTVGNGVVGRIDRWPQPGELGTPVLLPGGEVGILRSWWNSSDESEWRWQVEFYNHR